MQCAVNLAHLKEFWFEKHNQCVDISPAMEIGLKAVFGGILVIQPDGIVYGMVF